METELKYKNIEARRFSLAKGPVNINNNSTLTNISEKEGNLEISFVFTSNYEPSVGLVKIEGELVLKDSEENIKKALEKWESSDKKNLPKDLAERVHNTILANCVVEATILSREVHLPAPIPTPRVSMREEKVGKNDRREREAKVDYIR